MVDGRARVAHRVVRVGVDLGGAAQVDDRAHAALLDQVLDVGGVHVGERIAAVDAAVTHRTVGGGVAPEVAEVDVAGEIDAGEGSDISGDYSRARSTLSVKVLRYLYRFCPMNYRCDSRPRCWTREHEILMITQIVIERTYTAGGRCETTD